MEHKGGQWDTKVDTGKSMKNALYILRYAKSRVQLKRRRTVKKSKPVALTIIELPLSEGISQSVTQSVTRKFRLILFFQNSVATC